ncbi:MULTISPECIES: FadR/GntR family transcriptional regulator [Providencia]|uniref:GntR family transcriptional regulator n=1 Tax=Providencia heimbachae ATCC 35613 TaxID=1354272 RepID=A0A1B7JUK7_9GAMM|nr:MULTISPECIES: FadR/GntR family transcriptional regulator [Providencia]MBP6121720.1 FadR family transcriptional regulator [Providencia sp.]NIH20806.1 FadR family transcriptional regulator [Providencia heimbachae]OAT51581.1 GntR family transcriptional regulator [Providencia heimbachae ATCC 35613]QCJ68462.1 FadR family transcriptional regulator [Providencia heimbachae]SQH11421.1 Pyruvate dehydrogenase complex repressor [Providencia heimbachae]
MELSKQQTASQKNLSYIIAENLGQLILKGSYLPSSILPSELELSEKFQASRTAIREAIKILAAKGMLLARPRIGTRVMPSSNWNFLDQDLLNWWINSEEQTVVIKHFQVVRLAIEPQACYLAALHATEEQKQSLQLLANEMLTLANTFDRELWIKVDYHFHLTIYQACSNPFLISFANLFRSVYQRYFDAITLDDVIEVDIHQQLAKAIINGKSTNALDLCYKLLTITQK